MKKSTIIIIGVIIAVFAIVVTIFYLRPHHTMKISRKSFINVSKNIRVEQLMNVLDNAIHERFNNNFIEINYEEDKFSGYFKSNISEHGSILILTVTITLRGLKYGYVNRSFLVGYGYIRDISCNYSEIRYEDGEKSMIRILVKLSNVTILYVRYRKSSKYCVDGILSIYYRGPYETYRNVTRLSTCISVIPLNSSKLYSSKMIYLADQIVTEKLEDLGIRFILPILISNVTYLGKMYMRGLLCDAYTINEIVNLSNLFSRRDVLTRVIDSVGKLLGIRIDVGTLPERLSQAEDVARLLGLSLWNFSSTFYICDNGLIYLTSHVHNIDDTIMSIRVRMSVHVIGYRVRHDYVNTALYDRAMRINRGISKLNDVSSFSALWLSYMSITDPTSRLLSSIVFSNLETNILETLHAIWFVKNYEKHSISYSISVKNNRSLTLTVINSGREPISSLKVVVIGDNRTSNITVNCIVPVYENSSINIECVSNNRCYVNVVGQGKCTVKGILRSLILPGVKYRIILYVRFIDGKVNMYEIPLLFNRSLKAR